MQKPLLLLGLLICTTHNLFSKSFSKKNEHPITKISILKAFVQFKGVVQDEDGLNLPGVTVVLKNTTKKTQTDANGQFTIDAEPGNVLVFSFIGYQTREVTLTEEKNLKIILKGDNQNLEEVTVTALGIERQTKSLTYSAQNVKGEELTKAKDPNPMNSLTGKVAGLQINKSSSGMGGSVRITIRGDKSTRNNQPLYVLDGLPITNTSGSGAVNSFGGETDRGDFLSTLNPDDIESITVLKGAGASALYGSQAANGAIQIVTKKGKAGGTKIDFSSNFMIDKAAYLPKIQTSYLQTNAGNDQSWGPAGSSVNQVDEFYQTGTTWINSISLSGGTEKVQNYFSYANTDNRGILPTNTFKQNSLSFRNTTRFFDKLTFDGSLMYSNQSIQNRPTSGTYFSALSGLYLFPRGLDFQQYQDNFEVYMPSRNMMRQNWWNINADAGLTGTDVQQNPYWVLNRNQTQQDVQNLLGQIKLSYEINDWLRLSARGTMTKSWNDYGREIYATTQSTLSGRQDLSLSPALYDNGRYQMEQSQNTTLYGDLLLTGSKTLNEDFKLNFTAGGSIDDRKTDGFAADASYLRVPNVFQLSNILQVDPSTGFTLTDNSPARRQVQSIFASTNFGYQDKLFLDLTARNDWSSTLAFTPSAKSGYFYWSAGLNAILTDFFKIPGVNFAKIRGSYANVGNDLDPYATYTLSALSSGTLTPTVAGPYLNIPLRPETTRSFEVGAELRFLDNRLTADFTWYNSNTIDQYFQIDVPVGLLNSTAFFNAGNIRNRGVEISLGYDIIKNGTVNWNTALNFTANRNKILELAPGILSDDAVYYISSYTASGTAGSTSAYNVIRSGGSFGDLWGRTFLRDESGALIVSADGTPQASSTTGYLGNTNPKAMVGWNNNIRIKNFNIGVLIDGRFGGQVMSMTQAYLNSYGVSQESATARDNGGVAVAAVLADGTPYSGLIPAQAYYQGVGNRDGINEGMIYSATNIRLRELSLTYKLPLKTKSISNVTVGLVGRNLFFFMKDAPYDPELSMSTATNGSGQGVDVFGLPSTRSYGINLKCTF